MIRNKRDISKREETLQKKYDMLLEDYQAMRKERDDIYDELETCKAKLERIENAEEDFMEEIAKAKSARIQYENAYRELNTLRARYASEVNSLIEEIKG